MDPFDLADERAYRAWRDAKLDRHPRDLAGLLVEIGDLERPTRAERHALLERLRRTNAVLYQCALTEHRGALLAFCEQLGLARPDRNPAAGEDGLSAIRVDGATAHGEFIPYTDRPLRWHTDGYYNPPERPIRAFLLHCVRPAAQGGENALLDPEIAYIHLRDRDPRLVAALMHPAALTIPAHVVDGVVRRPAVRGPVFSVTPGTGKLHMRYTDRRRHVAWRDDAATRAALETLASLLAAPPPEAFGVRLEAGQGILCNNVLHMRTAFEEGPAGGRLIYRARFRERVPGS